MGAVAAGRVIGHRGDGLNSKLLGRASRGQGTSPVRSTGAPRCSQTTRPERLEVVPARTHLRRRTRRGFDVPRLDDSRRYPSSGLRVMTSSQASQAAAIIVAQANSKLARDMPDPMRYEIDLDRYRGLLESLESPDVKVTDLSDAGKFLGGLLLTPTVRELFCEAYSALGGSEGLRLRIRCKDDIMKQLPWEFARIDMGDGAEPTPLAVNPRLSLVRYEELQVPPPQPGLRTELVVSSLDAGRAGGTSYVDLPPDPPDIPRRYNALPVDVLLVDPPTRESLEVALHGQRVDIFHFSGHGERPKSAGSPSGLVLDYADRRGADILTGTDLAPILDRAGVSLAVLSACHSGGGLAQELVHTGIPIVVAMQHQIEATHAVEFNKSFYASLFSGATVDEAVSCGRIRLHELGAHYGRPVLYHRSDVGAFLRPITGRKLYPVNTPT